MGLIPGTARPFPPRIPGAMRVFPGRGGPVPATRTPTGEMVASAPPVGQPIIFPWWLYEMPGSQDFETNAINFVPTINATSNITDFSFTCLESNVAVLAQILITVNVVLTTTSLNFALYIGNAPVQGWGKIRIPPLSATAFVLPFNNMVVRMSQGDVLTAKVTEGTGVSYTCSMQGRGWSTPQTAIDAFMAGVPY